MIEKWIKSRNILTVLILLGTTILFIIRATISVAIVAMAGTAEENTSFSDCGTGNYFQVASTKATFNWDSRIRSWILSAFFYGYVLTLIPGGFLERRFGGKIILGASVFLSSVCQMLSPIAAYQGPGRFIALRVILGVVQGPFLPAFYGMCAKWAPPQERQLITSIANAGADVGMVLSFIISGVLANSNFLGGWPSIFYVSGTVGLVWCVLWLLLAYDSPKVHPRITKEELEFLKDAIGQIQQSGQTRSIPWWSILRSKEVWSLILAHFSYAYGFRNLALNLPSYMKQVLGFDIQSNGSLSALPFVATFLFVGPTLKLNQVIRNRSMLKPVTLQRILIFSATIIPAALLVAVGFTGCSRVASIIINIISSGFMSLSVVAILSNFAVIAPHQAGVIFGISNTIAALTGQLAPLVAGYVVANISNVREAWQIVFFVAAVILTLGGVAFMITVKVEVLPWAMMDYEDNETSDDETGELDETKQLLEVVDR